MTRGSRRLIWVSACFLFISIGTRITLALMSGGDFTFLQWARFMGVGLLFDLAILPWILMPWSLYLAVVPELKRRPSWARVENLWAGMWGTLYLVFFIVVAGAEFAFWNEFGSRFDFIAVDYLIYTHEVIGNIRESYPVAWWTAAIFVVSSAITWWSWPRIQRRTKSDGWIIRWGRVAATAGAIALSIGVMDQNFAQSKSNAFVTQLSTNGFFAFAHAYRNNELDYERYYPTLRAAELDPLIRGLLRQSNAKFTTPEGIERKVQALVSPRKVNVVLISVESLSAEFLAHFGNKSGITPNLDRLAEEGLLFTNLYATGTRTVRGLEALSIGTPPTPGQSIVRRPKNEGLENLGEELGEKGWTPYWIYGGYGFFDNMNTYFGANQYTVVDRADMKAEGLPIHSENIWGIADEDLYSLAIAKLDKEYAKGKRFFAHIMTTSNHRPYTFPENRVDLPQKHRSSAVKYTDWAIGDFIRRSAEKPWFDKTLFIIIADHTASAAGKTSLPLSRYHIPMIWYAPRLIKPGVMQRLMSQIDVGPTLLGWLGLDYTSRFFGYDIFHLESGRERAFISTYQKLGYLKSGRLVILDAKRKPIVVNGLANGENDSSSPSDQELINEAIAWYQSASSNFCLGGLRDSAHEDEPEHSRPR